MSIHRAVAALRRLHDFSPDSDVCDALDAFRDFAAALPPAELASALLTAIDCMCRARPEWSDAEHRAAVQCALREAERMRGRSAA